MYALCLPTELYDLKHKIVNTLHQLHKKQFQKDLDHFHYDLNIVRVTNKSISVNL
jgi:hypothetical protein